MTRLGTLPIRFALVRVELLKEHEEADQGILERTLEAVRSRGALTKPIVADSDTLVVLDGVHRLNALKLLGCSLVPTYLVDYKSEDILVFSRDESISVSKDEVIRAGLSGEKLPPKTTYHMVRKSDGRLEHISSIEKAGNFSLNALKGEGHKADRSSDSMIVCEYCGKAFDSIEMDDHQFSEHGVSI